MVRGSLVKQLKFDVDTYPNSYNYYDYDYCLETKALGYKVGVFDILLEHGSNGSGMFQDDWKLNKEKFIRKWKEKGYSFPIK
jgi:peptidoglycan/xylan/chitin deacetylase (PgdA/CDA1 family)